MMFQVATNQARNQFTPKVAKALVAVEQRIKELDADILCRRTKHEEAMRAYEELPFFKRIFTEKPYLSTFELRLQLSQAKLMQQLMQSIMAAVYDDIDVTIKEDDFAAIMWYYGRALDHEG